MENSAMAAHIKEYLQKRDYRLSYGEFTNEIQREHIGVEVDDTLSGNKLLMDVGNSSATNPIYFFSSFSVIHTFTTSSIEAYRVQI
jgi:hypothetical protein